MERRDERCPEKCNESRWFRRVLAPSVEDALDQAGGAAPPVLHTRPGGEVVGVFELEAWRQRQ